METLVQTLGSQTITFILWGLFLLVSVAIYRIESIYLMLFCLGVGICVDYFWLKIDLMRFLTFENIFIYLLLGLVYSIIRTFFYGKTIKAEDKPIYKGVLKEKIFIWWLFFPISLIDWLVFNLLEKLFNLIYKSVESLFWKVFNL